MAGIPELRGYPPAQPLFLTLVLVLSLGLTQGCARSQPRQPTPASSPATAQKLPFHSVTAPASAGDTPTPVLPSQAEPAANLPFGAASHTRILPAGTLLTVQLAYSLSTLKARAGDPFIASLAVPLAIDRDIVAEDGTAVTGRIESSRSLAERPGLSPASGYFRLTLSSLTVSGKEVALQTASLFAKGTFQTSQGLGVRKGKRLTFRLTAPVALDAPSSAANVQPLLPPSE